MRQVSMKAFTPGKGLYKKTRAGLAVALLLASPCPTFARLGDTVQSVPVDQAQLKASLKVIDAGAYTVHEMKLPAGTVIREYASRSDERVFGITWRGPFVPDLKQLLGEYFEHYSDAARAQRESRVGRHPLNIQEPGLVVQTAGHMGAFSGRAYDPRLLPAGVSSDDIR
jgi:hypothetical protein